MAKSRYVWHPELHRQMASERVFFLWLEFSPNYDQSIALQQVKSALRRHRVTSYVIWEVLGSVDMIVRLWLPVSEDLVDLLNTVNDMVVNPHTVRAQSVSVDRIAYHWLWDRREPDMGLSRELSRPVFVELNGRPAPSASTIRQCLAGNLIRKLEPTSTIKFFVRLVQADNRTEALYVEAELAQRVLDTCQRASDIRCLSVFQGSGYAKFVISGRVAPTKWEAVSYQLTKDLNSLGLNIAKGLRTVTHLSAYASSIDRREQLLSEEDAVAQEFPVLADLLEMDEGATLEFKSSAFIDVGAVVHAGERARPSDREKSSVVKAVTGMLNASGGSIVIGAAEASRFSEDELREAFGKCKARGEFVVIGLEPDLFQGGWDKWSRRLRDLLSRHITPRPTAWVDFELQYESDMPVAVIRVRRPDRWYYANPPGGTGSIFFVRSGNETVPLDGTDADDYKNAVPRTTAR